MFEQRHDHAGSRSGERGQSEVVGYLMLLAITIMGAGTVIAFGSIALNDTSDTMDARQVSQSMAQFDAKAARVALGSSSTQVATIKVSGTDGTIRQEDAGWMRVRIVNETTGAVEDTVVNQTLGAVVYQNGNTEIAYQGGGVWRKTGEGSQMVSPPEFHYRDATLTLPIVVVDGERQLAGDVKIAKNGSAVRKYPDPSEGYVNPLEDGKVTITVHSEYYRAWGEFFETRTEGEVDYDHAASEVTITLVVPSDSATVSGAVVSGASGETLTIENQGKADSYDSSIGPYSASSAANTKIVTAGSVEVKNKGTIKGDLVAGEDVTMENQAEVTGNVSYGGVLSKHHKATIQGWTSPDAGVPSLAPVDGLINQKRTQFQDPSVNENEEEDDVDASTDRLDSDDDSWTLTAGQYYLSQLTLEDEEKLVLNTDGGDIAIVVDGPVSVSNEANITVVGNGRVKFYLEGELTIENQATVTVPGDRSPQLWFYMNPNEKATIQNQAKFVGVIYGPGSSTANGVTIELKNQARIFGGLVGYVETIQNGIGLHFDEALAEVEAIDQDTTAPRVTYVHVTVNRVNVTSTD